MNAPSVFFTTLFWQMDIPLMEEILQRLIANLSRYLLGFICTPGFAGFVNPQQYQSWLMGCVFCLAFFWVAF